MWSLLFLFFYLKLIGGKKIVQFKKETKEIFNWCSCLHEKKYAILSIKGCYFTGFLNIFFFCRKNILCIEKFGIWN